MKEILFDFIKKYAPVSDEQAGVLADYALSTWQPLPTEVKYMHITGGPGTGKTITGKVMAAVCKNPLWMEGFESQSDRLSVLDSLYPTTCIIEKDELMMGELEYILKNGYEKSTSVMQIKVKGGEWVLVSYRIYGHKIILGGMTFANPAIESRCIRVHLIPRDFVPTISIYNNLFRDDSAQMKVILEAALQGDEFWGEENNPCRK